MSEKKRRAILLTLVAALLAYRLFRLSPTAIVLMRHSLIEQWPLWVSGLVWIVFSIYWEIAAKNRASA